MNVSRDSFENALNYIKSSWNKQSKPTKYLTIIAISIPSYSIFRTIWWFFYRKYYSLPPGPNGLPFLGLSDLNAGTTSRINLSKKYGEIIYTSYVGGISLIILSSSKLAKEILPQKQFLTRQLQQTYDPQKGYHGLSHL